MQDGKLTPKRNPQARNSWRPITVCILAVVALLYIWQTISVWQAQEVEASSDDSSRGSSVMVAWRQPRRVDLVGRGAALGETGSLKFNPDDPIAVLRVSDLPALAFSQSYQLWCYDANGKADASTSFKVPVDNDDVIMVMVATPRLLAASSRFAITV